MVQIGFAPLGHEPTIMVKFVSAGLAASAAEIVTFPLDTAKVRLMIQGEGVAQGAVVMYRGLFSTIGKIANMEGASALYSGLVAGIHRQLILGSIRIGLYDVTKGFYGKLIDGSSDIHHASILVRIASGTTTGCASVLFGQPTDVVKVRMQAQGASGVIRYSGALMAYGKIAREEGIRGLWKGVSPNAARTAIVNACEIVSYDLIKTWIVKRHLMTDNAPCHFLSGLGAALVTVAISSPVDVLKTRFMNSRPGQYSGLVHCAKNIWTEKGFAGYYKGCVPSFWRLSAWNILMFMTYEQLKRGITHGVRFTRDWQENSGLTARLSRDP